MTDGLLTHPTHDQLAAFTTGRLDDDDSTVVEQHLAACAGCCQWLQQSPGNDSYVALLRDAVSADVTGDDSTNQPTAALAGSETDVPHAASLTVASSGSSEETREPIAGLPSALVDHPRYRVIRSLGSGGMGVVFEAEHRLMRRRVAIKIIKPQWLRSSEAVARFRREMQTAAKLVHPHVVTAFDAEQAGDVHFLVMEFVDGMNLAELISQRGPLPVEMACECIRQAALGLQLAYEQGMVHRDIKPGNLMVTFVVPPLGGPGSTGDRRTPSEGGTTTVKILDFGLSRFASEGIDAGGTSANVLLGTPDFMAPEQARNARGADVRSDIYSLGCTLHFLLTGEVPHPGDGSAMEKIVAHLEREPEPLAKLRGTVPAGLQELLSRMIAKRPEDRFQVPAEVAAALASFSTPQAIRDRQEVDVFNSERAAFSRSRHGLEAPLAAGVKRVLLAVGLVGFVLVMAVIVQVVTDKGDLRIQSDFEGIVIVLSQNGNPVRRIKPQSGTTTARLLSGEYTLELQESSSDLRLSRNRIVLSRGCVADVIVSQEK